MDEGLSKKRGAHISGRLKNYMRWPIAMGDHASLIEFVDLLH